MATGSDEKKKSVLITGSAGRIGQILMDRLGSSMDLYGLDVLPATSQSQYYRADIANYAQLWSVVEQLPAIDYVIHLAADTRVAESWQSVVANNIQGTRNVYEASRHKGTVRRVVFASSNHVTGMYEFVNGCNTPNLHLQRDFPQIDSSSAPRPDGYYGVSKITGEAIARYYFDAYGIESACLRIGSVTPAPGMPENERHLSTWLSYSDLVQLVEKALTVDNGFPGFGIYYGVSNNKRSFWSIDNAREELGYAPVDDASACI